jgi:O-acetyl-ADP-ribose deacetylase (regulator of RNase III)
MREIEGNLIEMFKRGELDVIAHGCNCYATMGAGIAYTIGNEFPEAKVADEELDLPNGYKRLGKLSYAEISIDDNHNYAEPLLFNLYTQLNPGRDFRIHAFKKSLLAMKRVIKKEMSYKEFGTDKLTFEPSKIRVGFPLIGCGIAGGDWDEVKAILIKEFERYDLTLVHFTEKVERVNWFPKKQKLK